MLHYRKDLIFKSIIISVILWARLVTKIMTMLYKHNIWSNFLKIWLYTTRLIDSFLPTLLWLTYSFFPLKTHFIMQMEKNWKTLCLREKAAFCRGLVHLFQPSAPTPLPLAANSGTWWSGLVGVRSLNFDSHSLCDLPLFRCLISPLPTPSMPAAAASWRLPCCQEGRQPPWRLYCAF